jgi:iron(III) transport system substrate-binding protein
MIKRVVGLLGAAVLGTAFATAPALAQKTKVTLYTAIENEQLKPFKEAIEAAVPEADVEWVRDSTGVITARFLAEKASPKADMILGLSASSIIIFKTEGLIEPYTPKGSADIKTLFKDPANPPAWMGMDAYLGVVCFNNPEGQKAGVTPPKAWKDLLDPKYQGKIVMPHPASSGTGYLMVAMWLQGMGEAEGWKFMDGLHQNIAVYLHSGSAPCVQAAKGERVAGIGFDMRGASEKTKGAPIEVVVPAEGTGWEMEASAIVKGTKNRAIAEKIMDWVSTKGANELFGKYYAVVGHNAVKSTPPNYPADGEARMFKMNIQKMADERSKILAEWSKRYESKAAPKN